MRVFAFVACLAILGAVYAESDDELYRAIGHLLHHQLRRQERYLEHIDRHIRHELARNVTDDQKAVLEQLDQVVKNEEVGFKKADDDLKDLQNATDVKSVVKTSLDDLKAALAETIEKVEVLANSSALNDHQRHFVHYYLREVQHQARAVEQLEKLLEGGVVAAVRVDVRHELHGYQRYVERVDKVVTHALEQNVTDEKREVLTKLDTLLKAEDEEVKKSEKKIEEDEDRKTLDADLKEIQKALEEVAKQIEGIEHEKSLNRHERHLVHAFRNYTHRVIQHLKKLEKRLEDN